MSMTPFAQALSNPIGQADILFHVEDAGAANLLLDLPTQCEMAGFRTIVLADNYSVEHLSSRGFRLTPCEPKIIDAADLLASTRPRLVVVGTSANPDSLYLRLITAARGLCIDTAGLVDLPVNAAERFKGRTGNPVAHAPDWLSVPDVGTSRNFQALGFAPSHIAVTGYPQLNRARDRIPELMELDREGLRSELVGGMGPSAPIVLFLAERDYDGVPEADNWRREFHLAGRGRTRDRTLVVLEELLDAAREISPRPEIVVRLHPKNDSAEFGAYGGEIRLNQGGDALRAVWAADAVVGMSTMLLAEAHMLGAPVLSILPRPEEREWLPLLNTGEIPLCVARNEILPALRTLLARIDRGREIPPPLSSTSLATFVIDRARSADKKTRLGATP